MTICNQCGRKIAMTSQPVCGCLEHTAIHTLQAENARLKKDNERLQNRSFNREQENDRLRERIRYHAIAYMHGVGVYNCGECGEDWKEGEPEIHTEGCLAEKQKEGT